MRVLESKCSNPHEDYLEPGVVRDTDPRGSRCDSQGHRGQGLAGCKPLAEDEQQDIANKAGVRYDTNEADHIESQSNHIRRRHIVILALLRISCPAALRAGSGLGGNGMQA